jgi:hypothetical protein
MSGNTTDLLPTTCIGLRKVEQLRKLLEARFARAAAIGARSLAADWTVSMGGFIGEASAWPLSVYTQKSLPDILLERCASKFVH